MRDAVDRALFAARTVNAPLVAFAVPEKQSEREAMLAELHAFLEPIVDAPRAALHMRALWLVADRARRDLFRLRIDLRSNR